LSYWGIRKNYSICKAAQQALVKPMYYQTGGGSDCPGLFFPLNYSRLPVAIANLTSPIAFVTWISRGHASVQLKIVWQR